MVELLSFFFFLLGFVVVDRFLFDQVNEVRERERNKGEKEKVK